MQKLFILSESCPQPALSAQTKHFLTLQVEMHSMLEDIKFTMLYSGQEVASSLPEMLEMDVERQHLLVVRRGCLSKDGCDWFWLVLVALELLILRCL